MGECRPLIPLVRCRLLPRVEYYLIHPLREYQVFPVFEDYCSLILIVSVFYHYLMNIVWSLCLINIALSLPSTTIIALHLFPALTEYFILWPLFEYRCIYFTCWKPQVISWVASALTLSTLGMGFALRNYYCLKYQSHQTSPDYILTTFGLPSDYVVLRPGWLPTRFERVQSSGCPSLFMKVVLHSVSSYYIQVLCTQFEPVLWNVLRRVWCDWVLSYFQIPQTNAVYSKQT